MSRQLAFDLPVREARGRADFFVSPANRLALASIDAWTGWPQGKAVLIGPPGAGKSHLAAVWAGAVGANIVAASELTPEAVPRLAAGPVVVEDADSIASTTAETALFHLHNLLTAANRLLLLTATTPPRDWGLQLPDLASRMATALPVHLDPPDDALLRAVMAKQFTDRQIVVSPQLLDWLLARMTRSLATARAIVARLDAASLAAARPVTRQSAAIWLADTGLLGEA